MNKATSTALILAVLLLIGGAAWYWYKDRPARPLELPAPAAELEPAPEADADDAIAYPLPLETAPDAAPLPTLDDSDAAMRTSLVEVFGAPPVEAFLLPEHIVRRIVVTLDSLDRDPVRLKQRPVRHVDGGLAVDGEGPDLQLSPRNFARYDAYVSALQVADAGAVARIYLRYYPLFQKAYEELGYPGSYFNDRLIAVIDHLLAAPVPDAAVRLQRPKVLYEFADPRLEALSWGHKTLIRMGPAHAATVQQKLREIRAVIVAGTVTP